MTFTLAQSRHFYNDAFERDCTEIAKLQALGFTFDADGYVTNDREPTLACETLGEILAFLVQFPRIILSTDGKDYVLEIYNGYRE